MLASQFCSVTMALKQNKVMKNFSSLRELTDSQMAMPQSILKLRDIMNTHELNQLPSPQDQQ